MLIVPCPPKRENDRRYGSCTQIDVEQVEHRCSNPKCRKMFFKGRVVAVEVKCPWCNAMSIFLDPSREGGFP
jgi:hypothetical protein